MHRDGCGAAAVASHVDAWIAEKLWRQHMTDFEDGGTRRPGLELRGEILVVTRVGYTWQ